MVISQQHRGSPVQVQDCGIQRLKGGLDVGQPLAVLGGQAALQPRGGRIAVCSVARRRLNQASPPSPLVRSRLRRSRP